MPNLSGTIKSKKLVLQNDTNNPNSDYTMSVIQDEFVLKRGPNDVLLSVAPDVLGVVALIFCVDIDVVSDNIYGYIFYFRYFRS